MRDKFFLQAAVFGLIVLLIAVLAWLTEDVTEDPCANGQGDISAAVLADQAGEQDALLNRAIILRGNCDQKEQNGE